MARNALVTNGMDAIGEAACMRLSVLGYRVAVTYSPGNASPHEWLADMDRQGYRFKAYACDMTDPTSVTQCLAGVEHEIGQIDVLVNNGRIPYDAPASRGGDTDMQGQEAEDGISQDPAYALTTAVCKGMAARGWGRIIRISSAYAQADKSGQDDCPAPGIGVYGFPKAQLPELAKKGVTVNTISPHHAGMGTASTVPEQERGASNIPQIPVGRLSMPQEVAGLIAYFASDEAAFLTGAHIAIEGPQRA